MTMTNDDDQHGWEWVKEVRDEGTCYSDEDGDVVFGAVVGGLDCGGGGC